jgi:GNAT superfamily N-acetyltransferase
VTGEYRVIPARGHDAPSLPAIELAAAQLLRGHAPQRILEESGSAEDFAEAARDGRLFVALAGDAPVGFALIEILDAETAHLDEIDVHPDHGQRGLGSRLVQSVCRWAAERGFDWVTLTTFREVPWNMPFYARLGFELVERADAPAALVTVFDEEVARGLDPARRVMMRYRIGPH